MKDGLKGKVKPRETSVVHDRSRGASFYNLDIASSLPSIDAYDHDDDDDGDHRVDVSIILVETILQ
jgi:hypothetical protein